jgi:hypothetical protein
VKFDIVGIPLGREARRISLLDILDILQRLFIGAFRQAPLRRLELFYDNFRDSTHELVAQVVVLFALLAQTSPIEKNRSGRLQCTGARVQIIGREQLGPAEIIPRSECLDGDHATFLQIRFEDHLAFQYQIESIGRASFLKY